LHWRGSSESIVREIREKTLQKWLSLSESSGLIAKEFDGGIELRAAGKDKGDAVRTVISEMSEEAVMAYLGDDLTDEDAFREMKGKGLAVLVRPEFRSTAADLWLQPPDDLIEFLKNWTTICRGN
jgi:trehalose 6-phosphate phosphatase